MQNMNSVFSALHFFPLLIKKFTLTAINSLSSHLEIRLRLYGSSCTKFGFKDSDVNIDIQYPPDVSRSGGLGLSALVFTFFKKD